jgi:Tfp pilus assembly protein PilO
MSNTRPWILGAASLSVLLAVASWFLLISPERSKTADYQAQRVTQQQTNDQLRLDLAKLKAEKSELPAKQAELAVIKRQLPNNPALPALIRSLNSIAAESGAGLTSVAPSTPVSAATSAAAAGGTAVVPANLVAIPLTIVVDGSYAQSELFLQKLQTKVTRGFLVQNIQIAVQSSKSLSNSTPPTPVGNLLRTTIAGQVFVLLDLPTTTTAGAAGVGSAATTTTPSTPTN